MVNEEKGEEPRRDPRFILDAHLGMLAAFMRMMGYDAMYEPGFNDDELAAISAHEKRTLLSRDRHLVMDRKLGGVYGACFCASERMMES